MSVTLQSATSETRGTDREKALKRREYFSDHYFSMLQLCSQSQQVHDIHTLSPADIIEIGIGNGFTSTFLRVAGYDVTTADVNSKLRPDICAPLADIQAAVGERQFNLAVCCEVLEHMPWEQFESSIAVLRKLSPNLYLTLPNYNKFFGFSGYFDVPRVRQLINIGAYLPIPRKISEEHFWEVNSSSTTSVDAIKSILRRYYSNVRTYNYRLNTYHRAFVCSQ
jgi:hypothetical protein